MYGDEELWRDIRRAGRTAPTVKILECIGDDDPTRKSRAWVARIKGLGKNGQLVREFLDGLKDYSGANSVGSRGVTKLYLLQHGGVYEVSDPQTRTKCDRYFVIISNGIETRANAMEVIECLSGASANQ